MNHRDRHGAVQRHDGRRLEALQKIVKPEDLRPVRIFESRRLTMQRCDRSLHGEWAGPHPKRFLYQRQRFGDLPLVPTAAILLFEENKIAGLIETRIAPGIVKEHESEQDRSLPPEACRRWTRHIRVLTRRPRRMASAQRSVLTSGRLACWHNLR